eukprot:394381-Hanusia_phi.AAC.1
MSVERILEEDQANMQFLADILLHALPMGRVLLCPAHHRWNTMASACEETRADFGKREKKGERKKAESKGAG